MSGIHLVSSGPDLKDTQINFTDLSRHLEHALKQAQNLSDLEAIMSGIGGQIKRSDFGPEEKLYLKRLRQKGYDLRRSLKQCSESLELSSSQISESQTDLVQISVSECALLANSPEPLISGQKSPDMSQTNKANPNHMKKEIKMKNTESSVEVNPTNVPEQNINMFWEGIKKTMYEIDGEKLLKRLPVIVAQFCSISIVLFLLWNQSIDLYKSSGFSSPYLVALGGIIMIVGFAAYHSRYRSKIALLCCLYMGAYEAYFISFGTITDETQTKYSLAKEQPGFVLLKEQLEREKKDYIQQKARFENPSDKHYQNPWFKKKILNPAWQSYSGVASELDLKLKSIEAKSQFDHIGWLKIFYRLGLVMLAMLLVHKSLLRDASL